MSKVYAIYAMESHYLGQYGICDNDVVRCKDHNEAELFAVDMSEKVIEQHGLQYDINDFKFDEENYEQLCEEQIVYYIYEIKDTKGLHLWELKERLDADPDQFYEDFCL